MNSIAYDGENSKYLSERIRSFFKACGLSEALQKSNCYKEKGIPVAAIVEYLFCLVFRNRSAYADILLGGTGLRKDTIYRLLNSVRANWVKFTTFLAARLIREKLEPLTSEKRRKAFVIDDSIYERERSKKVELLSWVFDHAKRHKCVKGFRLLSLGWSDGVTFMPVNFSLMSAENEKTRLNPAAEVPVNSNGAKRRMMAQQKMTEVVPELLKNAQAAGIKAEYVLFDSWFSSPSQIAAVKNLDLDVVAMVKRSSRIHYLYDEKKLDCKEIYDKNKKRRGRSRYLLSVPVIVFTVDEWKQEIQIPAKLVYVRNRNKRNEYLVLLSTDTSLTEEEVIQLYCRRWDIEVFFKTCKSLLRLTKGCRSISYDAMSAHTAIVFARYMFLATETRSDKDDRTVGPLFCIISEELAEISVSEAFEKIQLFLTKLLREFNAPVDEICAVFSSTVAELPECLATALEKYTFSLTSRAALVCEV